MNLLPGQSDPIESLLDQVLAALEAFGHEDRRWLCEVLMDELGYVYGIGDDPNPVRRIRQVAEGVPAALVSAVSEPSRRAEAIAAARDAVERLRVEIEAVACED